MDEIRELLIIAGWKTILNLLPVGAVCLMSVEKRQGIKVGCTEEVAYTNGIYNEEELLVRLTHLQKADMELVEKIIGASIGMNAIDKKFLARKTYSHSLYEPLV